MAIDMKLRNDVKPLTGRLNIAALLLLIITAVAAFMLVQTSSASAQDTQRDFQPSADEFRNSCASCHGVGGKGAGFLTKLFKGVNPGDLTQMAKNNEGEFPFDHVFQVIDGRAEVAAHGDRKMPVWGDRYSLDAGERYEPYDRKAVITGRILELVYYIQSIQK